MDPSRIGNAVRYLEYIGANVRTLRRRAGMTQEQLAEAANLDARFIQRIERASTNLSVTVLVLLATALGVRPVTLLRVAHLAPSRPGRPKRSDARLVEQREGTNDSYAGPESSVRPKPGVR